MSIIWCCAAEIVTVNICRRSIMHYALRIFRIASIGNKLLGSTAKPQIVGKQEAVSMGGECNAILLGLSPLETFMGGERNYRIWLDDFMCK